MTPAKQFEHAMNNETKHTPGPWAAVSAPTASQDSRWIYGEGREHPVCCIPWQGEQAERLANAALIAAAPELLEALRELLACDTGNNDPMHSHWTYSQAQKARAAIARATGGETAKVPGVREDPRTGQFIPTVNGKDESPTSFDEARALDIAKQIAARP